MLHDGMVFMPYDPIVKAMRHLKLDICLFLKSVTSAIYSMTGK